MSSTYGFNDTQTINNLIQAINTNIINKALAQYASMPSADSSLKDDIAQYIGPSGTYDTGSFYKCVEDNGNYVWQKFIQARDIASIAPGISIDEETGTLILNGSGNNNSNNNVISSDLQTLLGKVNFSIQVKKDNNSNFWINSFSCTSNFDKDFIVINHNPENNKIELTNDNNLVALFITYFDSTKTFYLRIEEADENTQAGQNNCYAVINIDEEFIDASLTEKVYQLTYYYNAVAYIQNKSQGSLNIFSNNLQKTINSLIPMGVLYFNLQRDSSDKYIKVNSQYEWNDKANEIKTNNNTFAFDFVEEIEFTENGMLGLYTVINSSAQTQQDIFIEEYDENNKDKYFFIIDQNDFSEVNSSKNYSCYVPLLFKEVLEISNGSITYSKLATPVQQVLDLVTDSTNGLDKKVSDLEDKVNGTTSSDGLESRVEDLEDNIGNNSINDLSSRIVTLENLNKTFGHKINLNYDLSIGAKNEDGRSGSIVLNSAAIDNNNMSISSNVASVTVQNTTYTITPISNSSFIGESYNSYYNFTGNVVSGGSSTGNAWGYYVILYSFDGQNFFIKPINYIDFYEYDNGSSNYYIVDQPQYRYILQGFYRSSQIFNNNTDAIDDIDTSVVLTYNNEIVSTSPIVNQQYVSAQINRERYYVNDALYRIIHYLKEG